MCDQRDRSSERGATAVEYALMIAMIAAVIFATVAILGGKVIDMYNVPF